MADVSKEYHNTRETENWFKGGMLLSFLDFKLSPCPECCMLFWGWFPGFWILYADVSKLSVCFIFIGRPFQNQTFSRIIPQTCPQPSSFHTHLPAYEDGTECSETPVYKIQTPGGITEKKAFVVPRTEYFILFCSILILNYLSCADSSVGTAGYISQSNKQEGQITYHSHSNSKVVGTAENCC